MRGGAESIRRRTGEQNVVNEKTAAAWIGKIERTRDQGGATAHWQSGRRLIQLLRRLDRALVIQTSIGWTTV